MRGGQLTARQEIFAQHYALTGRASRSAIAAGANPASARTRAYRWLNKAEIQGRIEEIREEAFEQFQDRVLGELQGTVLFALNTGVSTPRYRRALRLLYHLGIFPCNPFAREREPEPELRLSNEECEQLLAQAEKAKLAGQAQETGTGKG